MSASSIYIGLLTSLVFLYIEVSRSLLSSHLAQRRIAYGSDRTTTIQTGTRLRLNGCDPFVAVLLIGDLIRFYFFLERRTNAMAVLSEFSTGNISSIVWTAMAALYLAYVILIGRFRIELLFRAPYFAICVLISVYLLSSAWSVVPMFSLYRGLELVVWVSLSVYFFSRLHSLVHKVIFLAIYCVTWFFLNFPLFIGALSHGVVFSAIKDNLVPAVGFGVAVLGWNTRLRLLFFIIGAITIVLAGSAASVVSAAAACCVGMLFKRNTVFRLVGIVCLVATLFFMVVYLVAPEQFPETVDFLSNILQKPKEELLGATGRYTIWSVLWDASKYNYFGTGFGSDRFIQLVGSLDELSDRFGTTDVFIMSAHNAALAAWLSAGWLGIVALVYVFENGIRDSVKGGINERAPATMILVFIILNNLTIPGLGAYYTCTWIVWIAVLSTVDRRINRTAREERSSAFSAKVVENSDAKASSFRTLSRRYPEAWF